MANKKQKSKAAFNQQAQTYDSTIKGEHARSLYPVILEKLCNTSYKTALDLGCGTGEIMKLILQEDSSKSLSGLDISEKMVEIAKRKLGNKATLVLGDSEQLPFKDGSFDIVYCNDSFHHYPAPDKVVAEVYRVLKTGGTFIICDCWQPLLERGIMNVFFRWSSEGDVKMYSEKGIRGLLSLDFQNITWEKVNHTSFMACGTKEKERVS